MKKVVFLILSLFFLLLSPAIPLLIVYFFSQGETAPNLPILIFSYIPLIILVMRKLERIYVTKLLGLTSNFVLWSILLGTIISLGEIIFGVISVYEQITTVSIMVVTIMGAISFVSSIISLIIIFIFSGAQLYKDNKKKPIASEKKKKKKRKK